MSPVPAATPTASTSASTIVAVSDPATAEHDCIRRAQARDAAAFEQLYRAHERRVYALCLRLTADIPRAEELTQKSWITAWEKLRLFRGERAFTTWLHRLAVNTTPAALRSALERFDFPPALAAHHAPPSGVTRAGILAGDATMRRTWATALGFGTFPTR